MLSMCPCSSGVNWCSSSAHWHSCLGHPASLVVSHVLHRHDLPTIHSLKSLAVRDACQQGKSHQLPFVSSSRVVKHPLEIVFSDERVLLKLL
jgi:hypothetical protein